MSNERITEDYVRDHFKNDPLFSAIKLDEQKTSVAKAKQCLAKASKNLTGKGGSPEFIISFPALPDDIIVVECKASKNFTKVPTATTPLLCRRWSPCTIPPFYPRVQRHCHCRSAATIWKIENFLFLSEEGEKQVSEEAPELLDITHTSNASRARSRHKNIKSAEITRTAIDLNEELNDYSIVEYERCTLMGAILLALQDPAFKTSYKERATSKKLEPMPGRLTQAIINSIKNVLADAEHR